MPKSMTFYWWKSCSQCRDMHNALTKGGASLAERDFFREPFTKEELRALIGDTPVRDFFSMKSPSIAKLGLTPESMSDDEMLDWMLKEPRLIRRPLVVVDGVLHIQPRPKDVDGILS
jgi:arsenate reductase